MQKHKVSLLLASIFLSGNVSLSMIAFSKVDSNNVYAEKEKRFVEIDLRKGINQLLPQPAVNTEEEELEEENEEVVTTSEENVDFASFSSNEIIEEEIELIDEQQAYQESISNRIYCKFEVSFYTTSPDEGSGTGIGASGEYVQPWVSIALPSDIPFYSTAYIEGLGTFYNHDTGSYIQWAYDYEGNLVCRVDVCVSSKEEAFALGRFCADGYIDLAQ